VSARQDAASVIDELRALGVDVAADDAPGLILAKLCSEGIRIEAPAR
jgi:hypothetical protein